MDIALPSIPPLSKAPMKSSFLRIGSICISLVISLLLNSVVNAQTSCDGFNYGLLGGWIDGSADQRLDQYCNSSPQDLVGTVDDITVTKHNVYTRGTAGGTATCTNYPKEIVITFSRPVADFRAQVWGARKATDNRGYTINLDPPLDANGIPEFTVMAFFPGTGITSITFSDPVEYSIYYPNGSLYNTACWEIYFLNGRFNSESRHNQCNCSKPSVARPSTQNVSSQWAFAPESADPNWSMVAEVTDNDGLVLRDIKLGQRDLAEKISVPYFYLETSALPKTRGELRPDGTETTLRSRLVNYYVTTMTKNW
jgi:hypothetical protein